MATEITRKTSSKLDTPARWLRQEYKTNKDKFEKPFRVQLESNIYSPHVGTNCITLEQSYSALGTTVWDGSIALAKMFENCTHFPETYLKKCRVLELGAGCGLVGITLCLLGAKAVVLTDLDLCLPTLQRNIDSNIFGEAKDRISVSPFVWGHDTSPLTREGKYDIVVASEVLYDVDDSKRLAQSAHEFLKEKKGIMFVSMGRNRKGEPVFVEAMKSHEYIVREVPKQRLHPKYQDDIIKVIALTNK